MRRLETDLHLHLDGSLSVEAVKRLAEMADYKFEDQNIEKLLTVGSRCESLPDYLRCFELPGKLLQTEEALEYAAFDLVKRLTEQGVLYAEIRFAPQLHKKGGMSGQQAVEAVVRGVNKGIGTFPIHAGVLLCAMVSGTDLDNAETLELAKAYLGKGVCGADIAGPEGFVPMAHFETLFRGAYRAGVPFTIHAGECGDYDNVARAVSYGARRIGHGCAAVKSEACMELLKKEKITLEMCVVSNLQTRAVERVEDHPLKVFYDRGIRVTYNTDNMTVSGTSLEKEAELIKKRLGFVEEDLICMNRYAVEAAFIGEQEKALLLEWLEAK